MAQLYNIDDEVVYLQADATGGVAIGTIASVTKISSDYYYTFDEVTGSFIERLILGLSESGAAEAKTNAGIELTRQHDVVVANADTVYAAYLADAERNIDALFG